MSNLKLLIVSNNCLSQHNSNGRTLLNLLSGFKRENLFQIYTSGEYTDDRYCAASYRLTNRDAINSYRGVRPANAQSDAASSENMPAAEKTGGRKTALTMLLRDLAWDWSVKLKKYIFDWAQDKHPDAILLQMGDSTHLIHIAVELSEKLNLPLITYNTEDYYFKNYDYMAQNVKPGIIYKLFHKRFCGKFKRMMALKPVCIYNCEGLRDIYDKEFNSKGEVVFCSTDMQRTETVNNQGNILYAGNLGVGRHIPIVEIGNVLDEMGLCFDVYGNATDEVKKILEQSPGIKYHGVVSYDENCRNIANSRLLVHVEGFDEYFSKDTRFAFSTKIADYCASGIPVFMYAPEWCESTQYALKYNLAFVADSKEKLKEELQAALYDKEKREMKISAALNAVMQNHQMDKNGQLAVRIAESACCRR
jgi:hypothetical protein